MPATTQLVSIIIAAHNRPVLLAKTLDSIGQLHYPHLEVIVVDDGSAIPIMPAIQRWRDTAVRRGIRLRALRQENQGPAAARNTGIEISRGKFIVFMDDDDYMHGGAIGHMVAAIPDTTRATVAMASHRLAFEESTHTGPQGSSGEAGQPGGAAPMRPCAQGELRRPPSPDPETCLRAMIAGDWFVPIHGYLFTRHALLRTGHWDGALSSQEDDELLLRAALNGVAFAKAPQAVVYYRQHAGVRRATPGKPNEPVVQGRLKRLRCDLAIRERAFEALRTQGRLHAYRPAFQAWKKRLAKRYGDLFALEQARLADSPLLNWLTHPASTLENDIRMPHGAVARPAPALAAPSRVRRPMSAGTPVHARSAHRARDPMKFSALRAGGGAGKPEERKAAASTLLVADRQKPDTA